MTKTISSKEHPTGMESAAFAGRQPATAQGCSDDELHAAVPQNVNTQDESILNLFRKVITCLVDSKALKPSFQEFPVYILADNAVSSDGSSDDFILCDYDGITHYDAKGAGCRIGIRVRSATNSNDDGSDMQCYKYGAIVGTLIHEMAHVLDGYHPTGRKAHSKSFYQQYVKLMSAATRAGIFQMPTGMKNINGKSLSRFDNLSPYSDLLDGCVLLQLVDETAGCSTPTTSHDCANDSNGPVRVTLQHFKYGTMKKTALINTKTMVDVHKAFKQKFPKYSSSSKNKAKTEFLVQPAQVGTEAFLLGEKDVECLRQGDTIICRQKIKFKS